MSSGSVLALIYAPLKAINYSIPHTIGCWGYWWCGFKYNTSLKLASNGKNQQPSDKNKHKGAKTYFTAEAGVLFQAGRFNCWIYLYMSFLLPTLWMRREAVLCLTWLLRTGGCELKWRWAVELAGRDCELAALLHCDLTPLLLSIHSSKLLFHTKTCKNINYCILIYTPQ